METKVGVLITVERDCGYTEVLMMILSLYTCLKVPIIKSKKRRRRELGAWWDAAPWAWLENLRLEP